MYINPLSKNAKGKVENPPQPQQPYSISLIKAMVPIFKPMAAAFVTKQIETMMGGAKGASSSGDQGPEGTPA